MNPADRRIKELIDKWLTSIDLHLQYVELSDAAYARTQAWPKHDRPTRWVLEVARQKILELQAHSETRHAMGDGKFAESLELMAFLANLVGIQHIQRFVPLAELPRESGAGSTSINKTVEAPTLIRAARARATDDTTREMPRLRMTGTTDVPADPVPLDIAAPQATVAASVAARPATAIATLPPVSVTADPAAAATAPRSSSAQRPAAVPRSEQKPAARAVTSAGSKTEPAAKPISADQKNKIIADAVRLLKWGKPWHELAELIGRIADRPAVPEIRKLLRAHKTDIEAKAKTRSVRQ